MSIDAGFKDAPLEQRLDYLGTTTARGAKEMREAAKAIRDKDAEIAKLQEENTTQIEKLKQSLALRNDIGGGPRNPCACNLGEDDELLRECRLHEDRQ